MNNNSRSDAPVDTAAVCTRQGGYGGGGAAGFTGGTGGGYTGSGAVTITW